MVTDIVDTCFLFWMTLLNPMCSTTNIGTKTIYPHSELMWLCRFLCWFFVKLSMLQLTIICKIAFCFLFLCWMFFFFNFFSWSKVSISSCFAVKLDRMFYTIYFSVQFQFQSLLFVLGVATSMSIYVYSWAFAIPDYVADLTANLDGVESDCIDESGFPVQNWSWFFLSVYGLYLPRQATVFPPFLNKPHLIAIVYRTKSYLR